MNILVVAATELEISPSIPTLTQYQTDYLITGVGMVSTAYALGRKLASKSYDFLLNVGIAGTFNPDHQIGSLFKVKNDRIFGFGAENRNEFLPIEQMGFGQSAYQEQLPHFELKSALYKLPESHGITVNLVHGNQESIQRVKQFIDPNTLESMEGAAFFFAAHEAKTACAQVRAISNFVEERNTQNWNIPKAVLELNNWLQEFIIQYKSESDFQ